MKYLLALALLVPLGTRADGDDRIRLGGPELVSGIPGKEPLTNAEIEKWLDDPANHEELSVRLPMGLALGEKMIKGLDANPLTRAKVELGRQLYFDTRLSSDNTISCASCHHPDEGYARQTRFGIGVDGQEGGRNSPASYNRILSDLQFWDGRAGSLEEQAVGPIANPIEMGNTHEVAVKTLKGIPGYAMQFEAVFGDEGVTIENVGKAIAAFERVVVTNPSPYDYNEVLRKFSVFEPEDLMDLKEDDPETYAEYEAAQAGAAKFPMNDSAKRGRELFFGKAKCSACHVGPNLADEKYHNLGVGVTGDNVDVGRYAVTKQEKDWGAFKTPTIRNVALTAPYMHDGSMQTLEEVVEHYDKGGVPNKALSETMVKLNLTKQEKADLVAFMKACTGPFPKVETARLPK